MFVISPEQKDDELCLPLQREEYEVLEVSSLSELPVLSLTRNSLFIQISSLAISLKGH